jgi:hypothetical protein
MSRRFPVRWLTYRSRIREDVKVLYARPEGKQFFSKEYVDGLSAEARRLESWEIRLIVVQLTIGIFLIVGFLSTNASVTFFGLSFKDAAGIKEIMLALSATISVLSIIISYSKNALLYVTEVVIELSTSQEFVPFARLPTATAFSLKSYFARQYERWVFSTFITKLLFAMLVGLAAALVFIVIAFSTVLYVMLFLDIYHRPTLGGWSTAILVYAAIAWIFCLISVIRFSAPLPFQDRGPVRKL